MIARMLTRAALAAGVMLAAGTAADAAEPKRGDRSAETTVRLDRKTAAVADEETEEMCRRRRLRRRAAMEAYYAPPPVTYTEGPSVYYPPQPSVVEQPAGPKLPTLPSPTPTPMPAKRSTPPEPTTGPTLGPVPSAERMVAVPARRALPSDTYRLKGR